MSYLLLKIVLLMIGAAVFGGLYVRWRLWRHYEDVTSEFARMRGEGLAWRHAVDGYLQKIAKSSTVDLVPVQQRLERVEEAVRGIVIHKPIAPDFTRVLNAISAIPRPPPAAAAAEVDLKPVHVRLLGIEQAVRGITSQTSSHAALSAQANGAPATAAPPAAPVDLEPLERRLAALEHAVRTIVIRPTQQADMTPLLAKLDEIAKSIPAVAAAPGVGAPSTATSGLWPSEHIPPTVRDGSRNLLSHAGYGRADDLRRLKGVKTVMERMLHDIGVYYFWQIAEWSEEDVTYADAQLVAFHGRIKRDKWVEQATTLQTAPGAASKPASASRPTE